MPGYKFDKIMNYQIIIGFLLVFLFIGSYALEYSLLENLEMTCFPRDNCLLAHRSSFANRNCECDDLCHVFRDCCIDKARLAPLDPNIKRKYICMTFGKQNKDGVYIVDTCPHNYTASPDIQSLCHEGDSFIDPLMSVPVTAISTGTTFKNKYCAECNGASPSSLVTWLVDLNCETLTPLQLNDSYIWQNVKYNLSLKTWGVKLDDEFHRCELIYDKPSSVVDVRYCRGNTIDRCPLSYRRVNIKRLCESYSAVVYDTENSYKNPHCAVCNNKRASDLICLDSELFMRNHNRSLRPARRHTRETKRVKPFSFAVLLSYGNHPNGNDSVVQKCPTGEVYDRFFKKCRVIPCHAIPGFKVVNGRCRKV